MDKTTLTAKVSPEVAKAVGLTGYAISDVLQIGLEIFLELSPEEQEALINGLTRRKRQQRAMEKLGSLR